MSFSCLSLLIPLPIVSFPWRIVASRANKLIEHSVFPCEVPGIDFVQNAIGGGYLLHTLCQSLEWQTAWEEREPENYSAGREGGGGGQFFTYNSLLHDKKAARTVVFQLTVKKKHPYCRESAITFYPSLSQLFYFCFPKKWSVENTKLCWAKGSA